MWIIAAAYGAMVNPLFEENRERVGAGLVWRANQTTWFSSAPTLQVIAGWNSMIQTVKGPSLQWVPYN